MKLTYEDLFAIPDDGRRHEIIDGTHYVSGSPSLVHQLVISELVTQLGNHVSAHGAGRVVSYVGVILSEHTIVLPDFLFISKARASIIREYVEGAPDLIVEVLSTNRDYDENVKYTAYEASGVPEYWIIDPDAESARVFRHARNGFAPVPLSEIITTPLLPGFELRVADLFAESGTLLPWHRRPRRS